MAPAKYELDKEQMSTLEASFVSMPMRDGWDKKLETINEKTSQIARSMFMLTPKINEKTSQIARSMFMLTPKCPEQMEGLRKLQEAQHWFEQAIKRHEF